MEEVSQNKIDDLIENGYALRVSDYISGGFQMVKDNLGLFVGYTLITFIINGFAAVVPFGALAVSAPLTAGFFLAANKINNGYELEFADFFKGFDYFGQLVVYSLIFILLFAALAVPSGLLVFSMIAFDFNEGPAILFGLIFGLAILAVVIYLAVSYMWAPHLILFARKKAWESMETSRNIIKQDFWNFVGFGLLLGLINIAGFLCFGVGLLYTIPASACALYLAFEDVTDMRLGNSDGYIEKHLVD
jgi:hypothetical protein